MLLHRNIHKYTLPSLDEKTHNQIYQILIDRRKLSSILNVILSTIWWLQNLGKDWQ